MLVTALGRVMEVREDIPKHKYEGIVSTSSPKVKEVMLEDGAVSGFHPAQFLAFHTTEVRAVQPLNA